VKYNDIFKNLFISLFFGNSRIGQTRRWIFTLNGSNDTDSYKGVPFGVSLTLPLILGATSPSLFFGGENRRFQAKRAKHSKFHVIETTASISTDFCKNDRDHQAVIMGLLIVAQQIQDDGRPPF